jgi:hypothetical protein
MQQRPSDAFAISTSLLAAASGSVKGFGPTNFMGCAEMRNVDQALIEPVAVERLATGAA